MPDQRGVSFETARQFFLALPGVEEGMAHGTPAFRVQKKFMGRLHDDGVTLVLKCDYGEREFRLQSDPATFYLTDHYVGYPYILIRLAQVDAGDLRVLINKAWRMIAPKRLLAQANTVTYEQS
jgi:hypothetical protein